ncbi:histidine kinase [Desulforamulus reducens MI-1]|uniref:histidine kinase n=1 Tax=Desulforamulus reducens (strain ATCC BAA-1160 / DSM 100696 / MI-1) TaxID=349161 RepID=A4J943_DESRM|nr:ATP-binding protein [Desulforamulus reducens]ABO51596.1 histidine kinase [Desulforamulus reducens MI-1]
MMVYGDMEFTISKLKEDKKSYSRFIKYNKHLEKIKLTGEIAAGIAHEIRNPMTTVRGLLQILLKEKECFSLEKNLGIMIKELDRANDIITESLLLASTKATGLKMKNLNDIIRILSPHIKSNASKSKNNVVIELGVIPDQLLNEEDMKKLIINLSQNGLEAMSSGGTLTIKTYTEDTNIILSVQDQGTGIKPDILEKLGTPFFSTKDHSGLGLAICYSIAARHNAILQIETGPTGTTVFFRMVRPQ